MSSIFHLLLWLATALIFALALWLFHRRARSAWRDLAREGHDRGLSFDQRCDRLESNLDRLDQRQRIDHLIDLVAFGENHGQLEPEIARRLRRFALELREESLTTAEDLS